MRTLLLVQIVVMLVLPISAPAVVNQTGTPPGALATAPPTAADPTASAALLARLPLTFIENRGQFVDDVRYWCRADGASVLFRESGVDLRLAARPEFRSANSSATAPDRSSTIGPQCLRVRFAGASPAPVISGESRLPGRHNFLLGADPARWHVGVPGYAGIRYRGLYPGIDLVYRGDGSALKYDCLVAPGADPAAIRLQYLGAERLSITPSGDLLVRADGADIVEKRPAAFQMRAGLRHEVTCRFRLLGADTYGFGLGPEYDPAYPLTIDPQLTFSTYFGDAGTDVAYAIAVDSERRIYLAGSTDTGDLPVTPLPGFYYGGGIDAFVTCIDSNCEDLVFSTFYGGSGEDVALDLALHPSDPAGSVYVTGYTTSSNLPTTETTYDDTYNSGRDVFFLQLDDFGWAFGYGTYLGGGGDDTGHGICVDSLDRIIVVGETSSSNFPRVDAYDTILGGVQDAFVSRFHSNGTGVDFSTLLGGSGFDAAYDVTVDTIDLPTVTGGTESPDFPTEGDPIISSPFGGRDVFVTQFANPMTLMFSGYWGGTGEDWGQAVAVDLEGNVFVAATTGSTEGLLLTPDSYDNTYNGGPHDVLLVKFLEQFGSPLFSTLLGGDGDDLAQGLTLDSAGSLYVVGSTESTDFPTQDAIQASPVSVRDAFVSRLSRDGGSLMFSTYLGGDTDDEVAHDVATDRHYNIYVAGGTNSTAFPLANPCQESYGGGGSDVFVSRIDSDPYVFVHLSDPHIGTYGGNAMFPFMALHINAMDPAPRFVLITGDLVHDGLDWTAWWSLTNTYLPLIDAPVYTCVGNHDHRLYPGYDDFDHYFEDARNLPTENLSLVTVDSGEDTDHWLDGCTVQIPFTPWTITVPKPVDTLPEGDGLTEDQMFFVSDMVDNPKGFRQVVGMHHPFVCTMERGQADGEAQTNGCIVNERNMTIDQCRVHEVAVLLSGHTHHPYEYYLDASFNAVRLPSGPAGGYYSSFDFEPDRLPLCIITGSCTEGLHYRRISVRGEEVRVHTEERVQFGAKVVTVEADWEPVPGGTVTGIGINGNSCAAARLHAFDMLGGQPVNHVGIDHAGGVDLNIPMAYYGDWPMLVSDSDMVYWTPEEKISIVVDPVRDYQFQIWAAMDCTTHVYCTVDMENRGTFRTYVWADVPMLQGWSGWIDVLQNEVDETLYLDHTGNGQADDTLPAIEIVTDAPGMEPADMPAPGGIVIQNYPNPFNAGTTIRYFLPKADRVTLCLHDLAGRRVRCLRTGVPEPAGWQQVLWDGRDDEGRPVATGVYTCRLQVGRSHELLKLLLLK